MFGADYIDGRPDPGTRIDPNDPQVNSGNQHWPLRQAAVPELAERARPDAGRPKALRHAARPRGLSRLARRRGGHAPAARPALDRSAARRARAPAPGRSGVAVSPLNTAIYPAPYVVVLNQYANFASVIDTATDAVIGDFETGFYGEDLVFNAAGTRLYVTDRFKDQVRAFRVDPGPIFTQIAEIPTGATELDRANPRDLALSADGSTLYVANTLGHTIAVINVAGDANTPGADHAGGRPGHRRQDRRPLGHRLRPRDQHRAQPAGDRPRPAEGRRTASLSATTASRSATRR